ncbi:hypothetical protein MC7420_111 [Coleofasciculus chthonoplastes PCC 7420]|uniref:Uncharacterized protein n=1 Tax=Coleofasciculus chthonoplastes PCC 7420 TaxID=118168 RepID=B4W4P0_9CYAN|nr:hypothetical protein MC7420_111 [Coleofasciculus chthonoplastes PCC 7420]
MLLNKTVGWVEVRDPTQANAARDRAEGEAGGEKVKFRGYPSGMATEVNLILLGFTPFNPTYFSNDLN